MGSFKPLDRTLRDKTNGLTSLSTDSVAKEGRPKFNPRPGRGLNPGPPGWQSKVLPTVPTSHLVFGLNSFSDDSIIFSVLLGTWLKRSTVYCACVKENLGHIPNFQIAERLLSDNSQNRTVNEGSTSTETSEEDPQIFEIAKGQVRGKTRYRK